jgi:hypothetical protein
MKIACISFLRLNFLNNTKSIHGIVPKTNKMKIALLAVFAIVTFSGCTKNYPQVNQVYSALYTVTSDKWAASPNQDGSYYTSLDVPELTNDIDLHGGVVVYLSFDDQTNPDPTYETLPEVIEGVAYGVVHSTGSVTVDLRGADGGPITGPITSTILIKVVLLQAQPLD